MSGLPPLICPSLWHNMTWDWWLVRCTQFGLVLSHWSPDPQKGHFTEWGRGDSSRSKIFSNPTGAVVKDMGYHQNHCHWYALFFTSGQTPSHMRACSRYVNDITQTKLKGVSKTRKMCGSFTFANSSLSNPKTPAGLGNMRTATLPAIISYPCFFVSSPCSDCSVRLHVWM